MTLKQLKDRENYCYYLLNTVFLISAENSKHLATAKNILTKGFNPLRDALKKQGKGNTTDRGDLTKIGDLFPDNKPS